MNILQDKIIVFTILFIVPVLRLMSDRDQPTRQLAAQTFGKLIQLMPLGGISNAFRLAHFPAPKSPIRKITLDEEKER